MTLARYAVRPETSRGRLHAETGVASTGVAAGGSARSPFGRDRARVIHCDAFRKLQYKTQVFVNHEGDFFRTRLTHSLEVAQIARSIARALGLDEDLTEALALAHDLGHPPFGHAGEDALDAGMKPFGGFDHNAQSLRLVTRLERRYAGFDGLNLTWEMLEGLAKHNGPVRHPTPTVAEYNARHDLRLDTYASAEAQVAAVADDVAYHSHDLDDALRAGLVALPDVAGLPVIGEALAEAGRLGAEDDSRLRHEMIRRVINRFATDLIAESRSRLASLDPADADAVREASGPTIGFSPAMAEANRAVKKFLFARVYHHWRVERMTLKARRVTAHLFELLHDNPRTLPDPCRGKAGQAEPAEAARRVADYIAGMTDRYAIDEHRRLTDLSVPG